MKRIWHALAGMLIWMAISGGAAASPEAEPTLQEMVNAAPANGVIRLDEKTYTGNVVIRKPLTIIGTSGTVIRGDGRGNVISILAPGVRIEGVRIEHGSLDRNSAEEYAAVKVASSGNVLKDLRIADSFHGIALDHADNNEISGVVISGQGNGIASQGNGIQLVHSHGNRLIGNTIRGTRDGIYFYYSDRNKVFSNEISQTRYGLHYMYANDNQFLQNRFSRNTGGAAIMVSRRIVLEQNEFSFHYGSRGFGLMIHESSEVTVRDNRFFQNLRGLYMENSYQVRVRSNVFASNQIGVELWSGAESQTFSENRFSDNVASVLTVGNSASKWSEGGRGNDWGFDVPLIDLDQNGVSDIPFSYQSSLYRLVEKNELVYLFLDSPAIPIYEKIEQLANGQKTMVEDPNPLVWKNRTRLSVWLAICALGVIMAAWIRIWRRREA